MRRTAGVLTGLLTCLASAAVLTACGVPPSSVIQAGEPAVGMNPGVTVYFLAEDTLRAVPRTAPAGSGVVTALRLLFAGPATTDPATLTTELPRLPGPLAVGVDGTDGTTVVVQLPAGVSRLTPSAMDQLVCTVAANPSVLPRTFPPTGAEPLPTAAPPLPSTALPSTETPFMPTGDTASPDTPTRDTASRRPSVRVVGAGWELARTTDKCP